MRRLTWIFLGLMILAANAPLVALSYEVGGCKSGSGFKNFTTISAAVGAVPAGATILVCAGVYPEQVTIRQPLTLKGIPSGNAGRAVITADANGNFAPNVTTGNGTQVYAQVLVENVNPIGPVNLTGITVDGTGINFNCPTSSLEYLVGIYYGSDAGGTINQVTARNQLNSSPNGACGYGIWADNESGASQTVHINASSVHHIGASGVVAVSLANTLTADVSRDIVSNTNVGFGPDGSIAHYAQGAVDDNVVTLNNNAVGITIGGPLSVLRNTVADSSWAFDIFNSGTTVQSNNVSNVQVGIAIEGYAPTIKSNSIMRTTGCALSFTSNPIAGTISGNKINDSALVFANGSGATPTGNVLFNVDSIRGTTSFCP